MSDTNPERSKVHIPENWAALPWVGPANELTIRALGALVSDDPIKNRNDAVFAVQAEVDRREAEGVTQAAAAREAIQPPPAPEEPPRTASPPNVALAAPVGPTEVPQAGDVLKPGAAPAPEPTRSGGSAMCRVRITKQGHGKVFTGRSTPKTYDWQAEVALPRGVALGLESKGYGEILD